VGVGFAAAVCVVQIEHIARYAVHDLEHVHGKIVQRKHGRGKATLFGLCWCWLEPLWTVLSWLLGFVLEAVMRCLVDVGADVAVAGIGVVRQVVVVVVVVVFAVV